MNALSMKTLAQRLDISVRSAYRLVASRQIDAVDVGTGDTPRLRVTEEGLARFLARREIKGRAA